MPSNEPETVSLKYTGNYAGNTAGVGHTKPGDIVQIEREYGEALAAGSSLFELVKTPKKVPFVDKKAEPIKEPENVEEA